MNKYQEALDYIKNIPFSADNSLGDLPNIHTANNERDYVEVTNEETFGCLQELIDKYDKIRWHDLRKNSVDIPELKYDTKLEQHISKYLMFIDNDEYIYGYIKQDRKGIVGVEVLHDGYEIYHTVTAWKYIEEFKDE